MVRPEKLEQLIERAGRKSNWQNLAVDTARIARTARVQHAVEVLIQLGHDHLAQELLRAENGGPRPRSAARPPAEVTPAA